VLRQRDRLVLYLHFGEDLTQRAIGERVGISQMQVSRILRSSVQRLGDCVEPRLNGARAASSEPERRSAR
jgi:RNA polymerase sigma-B factor